MKECNRCWIKKEYKYFNKDKTKKDWYHTLCIICRWSSRKTRDWLITSIYNHHTYRIKKWYPLPDYTKEELSDWIYSQNHFNNLYNTWKQSWYKKDLIPSVDRLDDYKWYSLNNIQLVTWKENNEKHYKDKKEWRNTKNCKWVIWTYVLTWEQTEYHSQAEASRQTWCPQSCISLCCRWEASYSNWYKWEFLYE